MRSFGLVKVFRVASIFIVFHTTRRFRPWTEAPSLQYRFNDIELDTASMELRCAGASRVVEPQVFDLLRVLTEYRDRVVSRDDLISCVWNGRIVSETTISARINAARRAVGDTGSRQSVIKTVSRRGYRFIANIKQAASSNPGTTLY